MSHLIYSEQQLVVKSLEQLKALATQLGCTPEGDKRGKDAWVQAIVNHQSTQIQQVAQAELNAYIEQQAQEVTEITEREITCYDYQILANGEVIAEIQHDCADFVTQRWVVMVNGKEFWRANTYVKCSDWIVLNYKRGTLPKHQSEVQPVEQPQSDNAVMATIANECDKLGFEVWDEGIFQGDTKLGEVGCTNGSWWVVRTNSEHQQPIPCDSVFDAVWSLWMCTETTLITKGLSQMCTETTNTTSGEIPPYVYRDYIDYRTVR